MAVTLSVTNAQAIEMCDDAVDSCDLGSSGTATLVMYSGTAPTNVDTALSGNTVLAQLSMSFPAFGNAIEVGDAAVATANAISDDTAADADGTASFFRILDRNGTPRIQGEVATSGAALNMNSVEIRQNAVVRVTSLTHQMNEA